MNVQNMAKQANFTHASEALDFLVNQAAKDNVTDEEAVREMAAYLRVKSEIQALEQQLAAAHEELDMANHMAENVQNYLRSRESELARIKRLAETGTAESFLALSDDDKRKWFAMAIDESARRKRADELLEAAEARCAELQQQLAAAREALQAAEADVALLNAGCIITTDRDELGNDERVFRSGMNLRSAISEAAEYQRRSDATLQRDRQP